MTKDEIEALLVDRSDWAGQMMQTLPPGEMVVNGNFFRDVAPGTLVEGVLTDVLTPDAGGWEARGPLSTRTQHVGTPSGALSRYTFRVRELVVHGPAYGSRVAATRYVYAGGEWGARTGFAGRRMVVVGHTTDAEPIENEILSASIDGALDTTESDALWLLLSFISGNWLKAMAIERYDEHGVLIETVYRRGGRSASTRKEPFNWMHARPTPTGVEQLGSGIVRLLRAGFPIDVVLEHLHSANTDSPDIDAQRLTLAIHTALEAWNRAFGLEYWIDDDCWESFAKKVRRPLVGVIYDTIGPEVTKNLASGFRHANRTTTAWREDKLFADLQIDVSSTENERALAARDEILHNGYFLKRWRHLTTAERQERRDDVARLRRLALLIIFRLTGFEGQFLEPVRLIPEHVSPVAQPATISPAATPTDTGAAATTDGADAT